MTAPLDRLLQIMARLRDPESGCPWDVQQSFDSIAPYTIEEAYEVAAAIERRDIDDLRDELGDLLLQVVFHAQIAREAGHFDFHQVAATIADKMVRRHPHVFDRAEIGSADAQRKSWEEHKAAERQSKNDGPAGALDGVALALPALMRAAKLGKRAARVGFDWPSLPPVLDKIREELGEVEAEIDAKAPTSRLTEEVGDLLFACANLARHLGVDPESALRGANGRFERRFRRIEHRLAQRGQSAAETGLDELEALWNEAKEDERMDGETAAKGTGQ